MKFSKDYRAMNPAKITTTVGLNSMQCILIFLSASFDVEDNLNKIKSNDPEIFTFTQVCKTCVKVKISGSFDFNYV